MALSRWSSLEAQEVESLLLQYFEITDEIEARRQAQAWMQIFPHSWVRLATLEALYQGRYKVRSVEQILSLWQRRGQPACRYTPDFARLVGSGPAIVVTPIPVVIRPFQSDAEDSELLKRLQAAIAAQVSAGGAGIEAQGEAPEAVGKPEQAEGQQRGPQQTALSAALQ